MLRARELEGQRGGHAEQHVDRAGDAALPALRAGAPPEPGTEQPAATAKSTSTASAIAKKTRPSTRICVAAAPRWGSTNCGRKARKKSPTLGFSTLTSVPSAKRAERRPSGGDRAVHPARRAGGSQAQEDQVCRTGVLEHRERARRGGDQAPTGRRRLRRCARASRPDAERRGQRRAGPQRGYALRDVGHVRPGDEDQRQRGEREDDDRCGRRHASTLPGTRDG